MPQKPELLSPAGSINSMRYAFAYGADAVYAGQPRYSMRVRNNSFDIKGIAQGIEEARRQDKKFYVASNISPHNAKVKTYLKDIAPIIEMRPDALIMSDPGLISMVKERWPEQVIHLSVQCNVLNYATAKFWGERGVKRIILSRELSLEEIAEIRAECPSIELEVFVHGALCMAYSGRCLLSGYINKRDPNQGTCTNACRWKYKVRQARETDFGDVIPCKNLETEIPKPTLGAGDYTEDVVLLEEENRPGEYMPAFEDEHGTYIMNSKDLRAVQHIPRLTAMGICSFKIEGRTKSFYYVARTAQIYRNAIDDTIAGKTFNMDYMDMLENLSNRGYTEGFYRRHVHDEYQNYLRGYSESKKQQYVGQVLDFNDNRLIVDVKNRFQVGDSVELMTTTGNHTFTLNAIEDKTGKSVSIAPGSGHCVAIRLPENITPDPYSLLVRNIQEK